MSISNQCDMGYHNRCRDKDCECGCHKQAKKILFTIALATLFAACGTHEVPAKEGATDTAPKAQVAQKDESPISIYAADAGALPDCTDAKEGELAYVKADKEFQVCASGAWEVVSIVGPKGDAGSAGKDGVDGTNGTNAVAGSSEPGLNTWWLNPDTGKQQAIVSLSVVYASACPSGSTVVTGSVSQKFLDYFAIYLSSIPTSALYWTSATACNASSCTMGYLDHTGVTVAAYTSTVPHVAICEK